jgi:amino acid transporter
MKVSDPQGLILLLEGCLIAFVMELMVFGLKYPVNSVMISVWALAVIVVICAVKLLSRKDTIANLHAGKS